MVIDDLEGSCSSGVESDVVITKVQVGAHGLIVQIAEVL